MTRNVTFKTLWLVSENERKAKKQTFPTPKTILFGPNGTGKSRITKNLFWTLGCSPEKHAAPGWDPDTIGALEFKFANQEYIVVRQRKEMGLFSLEGELIAASDNHGDWAKTMADLFGYTLMLRRPNVSTPSRVGIDHLTLPFYMDQDGGWGATWSSYSTLSQFRAWQKPVFEAFIGFRPNGYFAEHQRWQVNNDQFKAMQDRFETQRSAFSRVRQILPRAVPVLNSERFESQLVDLGEKARGLQRRQFELREKLVQAVNLKEKIDSELRLAVEAHRGLTDDLGFISEFSQKTIECPTCGTQHANSFHARLQLTQDSHSISLLVGELREERKAAVKKHVLILKLLEEVKEESKISRNVLPDNPEDIQARDLLLAAHGVQMLDNAFDKVTTELATEIEIKGEEVESYRLAYKKYEDRLRLKSVKEFYNTSIGYYSDKLNIPADEQVVKAKPGERGKVGGSSAPRSLLAIHMAMLKTNSEYGDTPHFPFVVDTLQQSGQDHENLSSMIEILNGSINPAHQTILALEMLPSSVNISDFEVVELTGKKKLLNEEDFSEAGFLEPMLRFMQIEIERLKAQKLKLAKST